MGSGLLIGVDLGGTKIAAGVVDADGAVLASVRRDTPQTDAAAVNDAVADAVTELRSRHPVAAVGIGAPGMVAGDRSTVLLAPNLPWRDEPVGRTLSDRLGVPVVVENDASCLTWAETAHGAARGERNVVALTIGTGIGGGIVVDGELRRGEHGLAAEVGHLTFVPDGLPCGCGNRGCWEQYASGRALTREARELARRSPDRAARLLADAHMSADRITGPMVMRAAREGDAAALEVFECVAGRIGHGMADIAALLDPGIFVLGGGVADAGAMLLDPVRKALDERLVGRGLRTAPRIAMAELGGQAGVVGAAALARGVGDRR